MRKISYLFILCMFVTILAPLITYANNDRIIKISINGEYVEFNDDLGYPFIDSNSRTQVPFRVTLEKFGATVSWDGENNRAVAEKDGIKVEVPIGEKYIFKNGEKIENDTKALIKNSRTYLPIRVVMEAFNCEVDWDGVEKAVLIQSPKEMSISMKINSLGRTNISVEIESDEISSLDEIELQLVSKNETKLIDLVQKNIGIENLENGQEYSLRLYAKSGGLLDRIDFKTFDNYTDSEIHYFVNSKKFDEGLVEVTMFGEYNSKKDIKLMNQTYRDGFLIHELFEVSSTSDIDWSSTKSEILISPNSSNGIYKIVYNFDMSEDALARKESNYALLNERYMVAAHFAFLMLPENYEQNNNINLSVIIPPKDWDFEVGMVDTGFERLFSNTDMSDMMQDGLYIYKEDQMHFEERIIDGTEVRVIIEKTIDDSNYEIPFVVYERLGNLWGGFSKHQKYIIFVLDYPDTVFGGERDYSQAYSHNTYFPTYSICHAAYHVWQGWDMGVKMHNIEYLEDKFWIEGFNCYYNTVISSEINGDNFLSHLVNPYSEVKAKQNDGTDISLFSKKGDVKSWSYTKGTIQAYMIDMEIRKRSKGVYTLEDVLKTIWQNHSDKSNPLTYDDMVRYINDIIEESIDKWWDENIVQLNSIHIEELESLMEKSIVGNTSPKIYEYDDDKQIEFNDPMFKNAVIEYLNLSGDNIYYKDIKDVSELVLNSKGISDISGIKFFTNLENLELMDNSISDLSQLSKLDRVISIILDENDLSQISLEPLTMMENLQMVFLNGTGINEISILKNIKSLEEAHLQWNKIADISPLFECINLKTVYLNGNPIDDRSLVDELRKQMVVDYN